MSYLLDTNACIKYLNPSSSRIINQIELLSPDDIFICTCLGSDRLY
ncbi:MAG: type II toxin-antitoxin system VapC family toxin [Okeania sp. SIO3B3]|nr:type II toxin-antitoxin system VapC family toxin [Okeania sp. SIO3B3]